MKGIVTLIVAVIVATVVFDFSWSDEVRLYTARCANEVKILPLTLRIRNKATLEPYNDYKGCELRAASDTTYKINRERGEVYWNDPHLGAVRFVDCAIYDRKNWTCAYPSSRNLAFTVIDGLQAIPRETAVGINWFSVRRWQYNLILAGQLIFGGLSGAPFLIPDQRENIRDNAIR